MSFIPDTDDAKDNFSREWYIDLWEDFFCRYKRKIQKFDGKWVFDKPDTKLGDYQAEIQLLPTLDRVTVVIDYNDISNAVIFQNDSVAGLAGEYGYEIYKYLIKQIDENAKEATYCARLAIVKILSEFDADYARKYDNIIKAEFSGILLQKEIPEINHELMNKFVRIDGVVIYMDDVSKMEALNRVYECSLGHLTIVPINRREAPRKCGGLDPISKTHVSCEEEFLQKMMTWQNAMMYLI